MSPRATSVTAWVGEAQSSGRPSPEGPTAPWIQLGLPQAPLTASLAPHEEATCLVCQLNILLTVLLGSLPARVHGTRGPKKWDR